MPLRNYENVLREKMNLQYAVRGLESSVTRTESTTFASSFLISGFIAWARTITTRLGFAVKEDNAPPHEKPGWIMLVVDAIVVLCYYYLGMSWLITMWCLNKRRRERGWRTCGQHGPPCELWFSPNRVEATLSTFLNLWFLFERKMLFNFECAKIDT